MKITHKTARLNIKTVCLVGAVLMASVLIPIQVLYKSSYADPYDDRMNALQREADALLVEATRLNNEAKTLRSALDAISAEKQQIQIQLDISQTKYDQLNQQIADTEKQISDNKDALGATIADLYVDNTVTPIEMLFSSKNISDYMDKQEYRTSVRNELTSTISKIKDLKKQLEDQKSSVEVVLIQQKSQRDSLAAKEQQQQVLINQTQGQEAAYQQLLADNKKKMKQEAEDQQAYYRSLIASGADTSYGTTGDFSFKNLNPSDGAGGCNDGYPYCAEQDSQVDEWQLYNRECVSYVAWALKYRFNKYVVGFNGYGNAWEWAWQQFSDGTVGSAVKFSGAFRVNNPIPGDVIVRPSSGGSDVGHVMIVEYVNDDGWIHVSQYNKYGTGQYSTMDVRNSGIAILRFRDR